MKTSYETSIQFGVGDGIGLRLANAAACRNLQRATDNPARKTKPSTLTGEVLDDIVTLGSDALTRHVRRLIRKGPLKTIVESASRTRIRVCGALDYVIDREKCRVWAEPAPLSRSERSAKEHPPWHHPFDSSMDNIDILNPLARPAWLVYVAARPGWFGFAFARHADGQEQLFGDQDGMTHALSRVTLLGFRQLRHDTAMVALRHKLATTLTLHIGPGLVNLAMHARLHPNAASLNARHLNLVWQHHAAFETMHRENPRLLTALTGWLLHDKANNKERLTDVLPQMRRDLLARGLQPKAWRYLVQHGMRRLLPTQSSLPPWKALLTTLRALSAARWPAPPPRGFLRLLHDAAGRPDSYDTAADGVPGWFWQMACQEARACRADTRAYLDLFDRIPYWAWLVREFGLRPDHNQRRRAAAWLREVAQIQEQFAKLDDRPTWALWLQPVPWGEVAGVRVVPLLSPSALLQESIALRNCADSYTAHCQRETHVLLSLREHVTDRRVALACLERRGNYWTLGQVAGPCNRPVPAWVRGVANQAAEVVRRQYCEQLKALGNGPALSCPAPVGIPNMIGPQQGPSVMAIKKSELYSSLWASCDELRGGMDASQYKDYVLVMLFVKYVSDKYAGVPFAPIVIPEGASFKDMVALKGSAHIGDDINKKILGPLAKANQLADMPDFNDATKLGSGKELVDTVTNLIAIFENPALDFSKNRAEGDDILGDAYEYLMRHFATESGKSKGQFYTPAEVSRIMAQIIGIHAAATSSDTTVYDPTCGSGSLLLKVGDEARTEVTLYGQEKDAATSGLARMNMILHDNPSALIKQGNTLANPLFKTESGQLKTFDFVVANPPFSDKRWSNGIIPQQDEYERFKTFGEPPAKQGDYAYLLHIVRSLKSDGKGACILPHGVLFRGNAEAEIRKNLVRRGLIKGIIGLPANLFFGTGIPACIVVIDKQDAQARRGIFMVDASAAFMKDGPKNRLREQDIHRIVDAYSKQDGSDPTYARLVPLAEIEKNDFNLNLPRYLQSRQTEDRQDIEGHLRGGIPQADVDALQAYWATCPQLRATLFAPRRPGYLALAVDKAAIQTSIHQHPEFVAYTQRMAAHFDAWRSRTSQRLKKLKPGFKPKALIVELAEDLLAYYQGQPLLNAYDVYQRLMELWASTWQDDAYLLAADGWKAATYRVIETKKGKDGKPGKQVDKGWACDLVPKATLVARYYAKEQALMDEMSAQLDAMAAQLAELEDEHGGDEGAFAELDKVNKAQVSARLKEIQHDADAQDEAAVLRQWLQLSEQEAQLKKTLKELDAHVDQLAHDQYPRLSEAEIQTLVVDDKWLTALDAAVRGELDRITQRLTQRVKELANRYDAPLPAVAKRADEQQARVDAHLARMGFTWN